jgi:hypothetical protein
MGDGGENEVGQCILGVRATNLSIGMPSFWHTSWKSSVSVFVEPT